MDTKKDMEELLLRYCEGALDEEEREQVEAWIRSDEEHERLARQLQELYWAADTLSVMNRVDTGKALGRVNRRIGMRRAKTVFLWVERAAAILFLPVLSLYLLQLRKEVKPEIRMLEVRTNPGMTTDLTLPDGTTVSLNSESVLRYPETFAGESRQVELSGEAFFQVTKDAAKRFVVTTPHREQIEVLGTSFNVEAFDGDSLVSTTLLSGKVNFVSDAGRIQMKPGEKLVYHLKDAKATVTPTSGESEVAWKDGKIIFRDTPFDEALRMLSKRYHVDFVVSEERYRRDSFTGVFTDQRLEQILEVFSISSNIRWRYLSADRPEEEKQTIEVY